MPAINPPSFDRNSSIPLYRQVEICLRHEIEQGRYGPGEMLPSVKALCARFGGLNHLTVRQAIRNLIDAGLVDSVRGRGTFVTAKKNLTGRIALVLPSLDDVLTTRISQGVQQVIGGMEYRTIMMDSRSNPQEELDNIRQLEDLPLDGAIIFPIKYGDIFEEIYRLKLDGFPFVLIDRYFYDTEVSSVVVDNYAGVFDLTAHLVSQGRKRIAWIGSLGFSSAQDRLRGFCDALNEAGLSYRRSWIRDTTDAAEATAALLNENPRPDAIVYLNDFAALEGMQAIRRAGFRIPQDLAVAGFDDIPAAALTDPPLTTVRQPMEQLGREGAQLLLSLLEDPKVAPKRVVLPVETILRQSS